MTIVSKRQTVLIPKDISLIYCEKKQILVFKKRNKQVSLRLKVKIFIENGKYIKVSNIPFNHISNVDKKKLKAIQGTTAAKIQQLIDESNTNCYTNLQFVGLGYRAMLVDNFDNKLLFLKLGYSHLIYCKLPISFEIACYKKFTSLFIGGPSHQSVKQLAATIRHFRPPEPYKGKGVLYLNEKINKKQGKKI